MDCNLNEDNKSYWNFTGPYRVEKAMNTLKGLLEGFTFDNTITGNELKLLCMWVDEHRELRSKQPFKGLIDLIELAVSDGILDNEEIQDIIWVCDKFTQDSVRFDEITADMMKLQGLFAGITADGVISKAELDKLKTWIFEHENLKGCWPYDEVEALIIGVLKDGLIDSEEHKLLLSFFSEFLRVGKHKIINYPLNEVENDMRGICAVCPEVNFEGKVFCITGKFENYSRNQIAEIIEKHQGIYSNTLNKSVDYLLIGADGNKAWAFSCYGRKVEQAINFRKEGHNIVLVNELDFWDAIA